MRVAILGCGSIGQRHLKNLRQLRAVEIIAFDPYLVAEHRPAGVFFAPSLQEVWAAQPETAFITSPTNEHVSLALAAVRHGCHVFIEKPLSHSTAGVAELRDSAKAGGRRSMVGCNMRFHPGPATVKRLLAESAIGEVVYARVQTGSYLPGWRKTDYRTSYSASPEWGGAILDCIHEIDLATWYFGPAKLCAAVRLPASSLGLETDGLAELLLRHGSGTLSSVHLNFVQRDYRRRNEVVGSRGTLYWDFATPGVDLFGSQGTLERNVPGPAGWELNQMYLDEVRHFVDAIDTGTEPMNSLEEATATLELALAARRS